MYRPRCVLAQFVREWGLIQSTTARRTSSSTKPWSNWDLRKHRIDLVKITFKLSIKQKKLWAQIKYVQFLSDSCCSKYYTRNKLFKNRVQTLGIFFKCGMLHDFACHPNLLWIVPILVYVLPKQDSGHRISNLRFFDFKLNILLFSLLSVP